MRRRLHEFISDNGGAVTVEFVLWVPIVVALVTIAIDATSLYVTHTEMWNVARDTARRITTGVIRTEADAVAHANQAMNLRDLPYVVDVSYDPDGDTSVTIMLTVKDMSIIGFGSPLTIFGGTIAAHVVMRPDPRIPFDTEA